MLNKAAEAVGATLGTVVGTIDRLRAEHPHPVAEAQQVLTDVRNTLAVAATEAAETARLAASEGRSAARQVRRRGATAGRRIGKAAARVKRPKKRR